MSSTYVWQRGCFQVAPAAQAGCCHDYRIGLTLSGNTVDLDPATTAEIGGLLEVPNDGIYYSRMDGNWVPAPGSQPYIFRTALTLQADNVTVDLDPATVDGLIIGGLTEPPPDSITYARMNDGVAPAWVPSTAGAFVADAPPPAPNYQGQLWYDSDKGKLYVHYVDADSAQWVQANGVF